MGLRVKVPWDYGDWASVSFYDARLDRDIVDQESLVVQYMTGCDVPPHVTLGIANKDQQHRFDYFRTLISDTDIRNTPFLCRQEKCFPRSPAAKELGAQGCAVVMTLEVPNEIKALRNALLTYVPAPKDIFDNLISDVIWTPHITIGYVKEEDEDNKNHLLYLARQFRGSRVDILGWY